ncbi:undecaprenyl-phosphate galactose phosphotransferase WbaP [Persephonella sp.]|uniref:undecaprenyl-phosphate galactose phosphotransferase WbaP n=1 Tax=Persephonella sp. TaxID=2060922 RepID=UPI00262F83E6|nr:undecaprenyl-phosphate galactose phosphotransferase WbaP [Persephonella sp.]
MKKDILSTFLLVIIDIIAFYISLFLAIITRKLLVYLPFDIPPLYFSYSHFLRLWWIPIIFILFIAYEKLYVKRYPFWDEVKELLKAITISIVVIFAIISLGKLSDKISRLTIILLWMYSIFIFPVFRLIGKKFLHNLGIWQQDLIIIGASEPGINVAEGLINDKHMGYKIVGFLDDFKKNFVEIKNKKIPILGKIKEFEDISERYNLGGVVIAVSSLDKEKVTKITNYFHQKVRRVYVIPDIKGIALLNSELYHLFMQQLFLIRLHNNLGSKINQILKRTFDILLSIFLLPFLLILVLIIAVLIKLDSPGPIFFVQQRIGKGGRTIKVYKFRSMYIDSQERLKEILEKDPEARKEWETYFKLKNDPRVTKVGKFLRKTSLDELPQIFNVLKGDMSFVGPRPVTKEEIEKYYKDYASYYYMVRPGITGLWQVSGRSNTDYDFRVTLDSWYVLNWSLWLDIIILFKTVKVVLKREGAY